MAALPTALLCFSQTEGELVPAWLSDRDRPWLRDLLDEARAAIGRPWTELARQWRRSDPDPRAGRRAAIAQHAVLAHLRGTAAVPRLAHVRQALFALAANGTPTATAVATIAKQQGVPTDQLLAQLFADLPGERRVAWPPPPFDPSFVILLSNRALAQGMLRHATTAELTGNLVRNGVPAQIDRHVGLLGGFTGFLNGVGDLIGLPKTEAHLPLLVAGDDERGKAEAAPALYDLGAPVDVNDLFSHFGPLGTLLTGSIHRGVGISRSNRCFCGHEWGD